MKRNCSRKWIELIKLFFRPKQTLRYLFYIMLNKLCDLGRVKSELKTNSGGGMHYFLFIYTYNLSNRQTFHLHLPLFIFLSLTDKTGVPFNTNINLQLNYSNYHQFEHNSHRAMPAILTSPNPTLHRGGLPIIPCSNIRRMIRHNLTSWPCNLQHTRCQDDSTRLRMIESVLASSVWGMVEIPTRHNTTLRLCERH